MLEYFLIGVRNLYLQIYLEVLRLTIYQTQRQLPLHLQRVIHVLAYQAGKSLELLRLLLFLRN